MTTADIPIGPLAGVEPFPAPATRRHRRPGTVALVTGGSIIAVIVLLGVLAPLLTRDPLAQDVRARLLPPSGAHWFGTDDLGRDVFARTIHAIRVDLPLAFLGSFLPGIVGVVLGALAGYVGGWFDSVVMRLADIVQAFPSYVLFLVIAFVVGPGPTAFIVAAVVLAWTSYARLVRAQVLVIRELEYVMAARTSGLGHLRVLGRHVLPNAMPQAIVYFASDLVLALLALAGLSFLGLGISQPTPEWGSMIATGQQYLRSAWWLATIPGLAVVLVGGAFALISEGIDDRTRA